MSTYFVTKEQAEKDRKWHIIDAKGLTLGRLATQVAAVLRGKHKPTFTPHLDTGDFVVVINAAEIRVTGNKLEDKHYYRYSGYIGGISSRSLERVLEDDPTRVIKLAVQGMLPSGVRREKLIRKLKVYAGAEHPHGAQKPEVLEARPAA